MNTYIIDELQGKAYSKALKNIAKVINDINDNCIRYSLQDSFILEIVAKGASALFDQEGNIFSYDTNVIKEKRLTSFITEHSKRFSNERLNKAVTSNIAVKALKNKAAIDVDYNMIPIITVLNEKNYITTGCCEGHVGERERVNTWIGFKRDYEFSIPIPWFDEKKSKGNKKYIELKNCHTKNGTGTSISWFGTKNISFIEQEKEKRLLLNDILKWAYALPKLKEKKKKHYIELYGVQKYGKHILIGKYNNISDYKKAIKKVEDNYVRTYTKEYDS